jgi:hypothetical protein
MITCQLQLSQTHGDDNAHQFSIRANNKSYTVVCTEGGGASRTKSHVNLGCYQHETNAFG